MSENSNNLEILLFTQETFKKMKAVRNNRGISSVNVFFSERETDRGREKRKVSERKYLLR